METAVSEMVSDAGENTRAGYETKRVFPPVTDTHPAPQSADVGAGGDEMLQPAGNCTERVEIGPPV